MRRYTVLRVIDGDTVEVAYQGGMSVRIIGIDTPETVSPSVPDECWGQAASDAAVRLLTGKSVALEFDPSQGRRDAYDRTLAYLRVPGLGDFGLAMISNEGMQRSTPTTALTSTNGPTSPHRRTPGLLTKRCGPSAVDRTSHSGRRRHRSLSHSRCSGGTVHQVTTHASRPTHRIWTVWTWTDRSTSPGPTRMDSTRRATGWVVSSDDLETLSQVAIRFFEPFA